MLTKEEIREYQKQYRARPEVRIRLRQHHKEYMRKIRRLRGVQPKSLPLNFNKNQEQVLLGSLLGDGCIYKNYKSFSYCEIHSLSQKDYLLWKNRFLKFNFKRGKSYDKRFKKVYFQTVIKKGSIYFKEFYYLFYPNGKKNITKDILNKLEPLGLAVWFMDDGYYNYNGDNISLYTQGFGLEGNKIIQDWFKNKWNINSKIDSSRGYYYTRLTKKEGFKFTNLIKPYIIPSMEYKIGLDNKRRLEQRCKIKLGNQKNKNVLQATD